MINIEAVSGAGAGRRAQRYGRRAAARLALRRRCRRIAALMDIITTKDMATDSTMDTR